MTATFAVETHAFSGQPSLGIGHSDDSQVRRPVCTADRSNVPELSEDSCGHERGGHVASAGLRSCSSELVKQLKSLQTELVGAHQRQVHALQSIVAAVGVSQGFNERAHFPNLPEGQAQYGALPEAVKEDGAVVVEDITYQEAAQNAHSKLGSMPVIYEAHKACVAADHATDTPDEDDAPTSEGEEADVCEVSFRIGEHHEEDEEDQASSDRSSECLDVRDTRRNSVARQSCRSRRSVSKWTVQTMSTIAKQDTWNNRGLNEVITSISADIEDPTMSKMASSTKSSASCEEQRTVSDRLHQLTESAKFDLICGAIIILNAIFMAVQTEYALTSTPGAPDPTWLTVTAKWFTVFFVLELLLRMGGGLRRFFCSSNSWNYFDLCIVLSSLLEELVEAGGSLYQVRMIRLLRITRLMRLFRAVRVVRVIGALRSLVNSLLGTMRQMVWAFVLIAGLLLGFGIGFGQMVGDARVSNPETLRDDALKLYWGTLARCIYTLFAAVSGGVSWRDAAQPLSELGVEALLGFLLFVALVQWVVLNVITAAFCESAAAAARKDVSLAMEAHRDDRDEFLQKCRAIFKSIDTTDSGMLVADEMKAFLDSETARSLFSSMDLHIADVRGFVSLLDESGDELVDLEEFVLGCLRLRGGARSIDMAMVVQETQRMSRILRDLEDALLRNP
eukprot:TRINITY_DN25890_c0_g3_i1.p1 TRINITY_DN25890_c0_g3~~TRINITY_DN25890_c0_g3_i1.p1  ORF type:complete len:676 (-),score=103.23 TRINITY_DN25890_c0_g3_i1:273-2300(-)